MPRTIFFVKVMGRPATLRSRSSFHETTPASRKGWPSTGDTACHAAGWCET